MSGERKPIKKEFTTYWTSHIVHAPVHKMSLMQLRFFDAPAAHQGNCAILPDNIPFSELMLLQGKKTKVTIEVIE